LVEPSRKGQPRLQATENVAEATRLSPPRLRLIHSVPASIRMLPSTRYYGSKRRLLPWIYEIIGGLKFNTALDIFGGSASVSLLLRLMRKSVTYHDGLRFNEDVARLNYCVA
jgi:adenine-specific DNA-methyltransferase